MYDKNIALSCAEAARLAYDDHSDNPMDKFYKVDDTEAVICRRGALVFVAFRGTTSSADWVTDARIAKITFRSHKVHKGFYLAYQKIRRHILAEVNQLRSQNYRIYITGHSLGAALATLAAYDLHCNGMDVDGVYTYGSPRVGDRHFAAAFNQVFEGRSYRHINDSDAVCRVPTMLRWRHVDQAVWYDGSGSGGQMITPPWWYGIGEIWQNITRFKWGNSFTDHAINDYIALLE